MSDITNPQRLSRGPAMLPVLAVMVGVYFAASWVLEAAILAGYLGEGASAALGQRMPLGAFAVVLALEARPRGFRQIGLLLIMAVPLVFWLKLAEFVAISVDHRIAKQGSMSILLTTFAMMALPAFAPAWLKLKRADMLWRPAGNFLPEGSIGLFGAVVISLPGLLAAFLLIDLLRAFAWLPVDLYKAFSWTIPYLGLSAIAVAMAARPAGRRQWTILGGTLAAVLIATTLASAGIAFWMDPAFHEARRPIGGWGPLHTLSFLVAPLIGLAARWTVHPLAGRHSPWPW